MSIGSKEMDECLWAHMRIRVREKQPTCKKSSKERNDGCEPTIFFRNANSFLIRISPPSTEDMEYAVELLMPSF